MLTVHCIGSFLSVRRLDQWRRQLAVRFYSRCCIMRSGVYVSRQIRLGITVVVDPWITYHTIIYLKSDGFDQVIFLIQSTCFSFENLDNILKSDFWVAMTRFLNLHWKIRFSGIYNMQNFNIFRPLGPKMMRIWSKTNKIKIIKILYEFFTTQP